MGRCITECQPSQMLSVQMPFCSEIVNYFTCPVGASTSLADSFARREYTTQLESLPNKDACHVSFKAFTC